MNWASTPNTVKGEYSCLCQKDDLEELKTSFPSLTSASIKFLQAGEAWVNSRGCFELLKVRKVALKTIKWTLVCFIWPLDMVPHHEGEPANITRWQNQQDYIYKYWQTLEWSSETYLRFPFYNLCQVLSACNNLLLWHS